MPSSNVRANAVALLLDVFPLVSDDNSPQAADDLLQKQFDAFKVQLFYCVVFLQVFSCSQNSLSIYLFVFYLSSGK